MLVDQRVKPHLLRLVGHSIQSGFLTYRRSVRQVGRPCRLTIQLPVHLIAQSCRHSLAFNGMSIWLIGRWSGLHTCPTDRVGVKKLLAGILLGRIVNNHTLIMTSWQIQIMMAHVGSSRSVSCMCWVVERIEPYGHTIRIVVGILPPVDLQIYRAELVTVNI